MILTLCCVNKVSTPYSQISGITTYDYEDDFTSDEESEFSTLAASSVRSSQAARRSSRIPIKRSSSLHRRRGLILKGSAGSESAATESKTSNSNIVPEPSAGKSPMTRSPAPVRHSPTTNGYHHDKSPSPVRHSPKPGTSPVRHSPLPPPTQPPVRHSPQPPTATARVGDRSPQAGRYSPQQISAVLQSPGSPHTNYNPQRVSPSSTSFSSSSLKAGTAAARGNSLSPHSRQRNSNSNSLVEQEEVTPIVNQAKVTKSIKGKVFYFKLQNIICCSRRQRMFTRNEKKE